MDEIGTTQRTYAQIAAAYAQAKRHRDRLRPHYEKFAAMLAPGDLVADVGCGPGFDADALARLGLRTIGLDLSPAMMRAAELPQRGLSFVQADMRYLPLGPDLDAIWCCAAMLHLPRAQVPGTLLGFQRVLKEGGLLYLGLKAGDGEAWSDQAYGQTLPRFFTYWRAADIDQLLAESGFTIVDAWLDLVGANTWLVRLCRRQ